MVRAFIADSLPGERSALRLLLQDLKMQVIGEAPDWMSALEFAPECRPNLLLVDRSLLPANPSPAISAFRAACPNPVVIILIAQLDPQKQPALWFGADAFISKNEPPDRVAQRLLDATKGISIDHHPNSAASR
ncbi:MAG TPA: response regulator [Anaerolineales bacterium]|nr:response regulator [Anaerolineales bacterium]